MGKISTTNGIQGFTMIELLMVIMLVAILGAVALPQFLDFRNEGKAAAANALQNSMNVGVKLQKSQSILRCNAPSDVQIPMDSFAANDITAGASPLCTTSQVSNTAERRFVDSNSFPANPYNGKTNVGDCVGDTFVGYCYDQSTGFVVVPTATSHSNTCSSCMQIANSTGTSSFSCSGSGCLQICNAISGDCTLDCPNGWCQQSCNAISGHCTLSCGGGNCFQSTNAVSGGTTVSCSGGSCS